jgi:small neutral amino acid transporter SnatA (MarC family)
VRTQQDREEQTVAIGTALGVFAVIMTAEVIGVLLLNSVWGISYGHTDAIGGLAVLIAGTLAIAHLVRSEKR